MSLCFFALRGERQALRIHRPMRRTVILLVCSAFMFLLCGCQNPARSDDAMEVIIEGGESFPDFLVGTWRADEGGWEFVFEPDGTISSAVISLGRVRLKPGQVTTVPMQLGGKGVFKPGPWTVQYSYEQRQLIVDIKIEDFRAELGEGVVKGKAQAVRILSVDWAENTEVAAM